MRRGPPRRRRPREAIVACVALALAATLPPVVAERPAPRYQVTFDVSQSMDVEDAGVGDADADGARPLSRLEAARRAAAALVGALPCGSRLGWSAFVGQRTTTLVTPLEVCEHREALLSSLEAIDGRLRWSEGSSVGKGLHQSLRAAEALGTGARVLMFTDGHEAPPLGEGQSGLPRNPPTGIGGTIVGVGGEVAVRVPKSDAEGRHVGWWTDEEVVQRSGAAAATSRESLSRLHEGHLRSLAELAGLSYARLGAPRALPGALPADAAERVPVAVDLSWIGALVALGALVLRFLPRRRRAARPGDRPSSAVPARPPAR